MTGRGHGSPCTSTRPIVPSCCGSAAPTTKALAPPTTGAPMRALGNYWMVMGVSSRRGHWPPPLAGQHGVQSRVALPAQRQPSRPPLCPSRCLLGNGNGGGVKPRAGPGWTAHAGRKRRRGKSSARRCWLHVRQVVRRRTLPRHRAKTLACFYSLHKSCHQRHRHQSSRW